MDIEQLEKVIVAAKRACYVGGGDKSASSRQGSHDLVWSEGPWSYRDSYFGGTDFLGQEVIWFGAEPAWAMNYHDFIRRPDLIDAQRAGETIKAALTAMYEEGRSLGGLVWSGRTGTTRTSRRAGLRCSRGKKRFTFQEQRLTGCAIVAA